MSALLPGGQQCSDCCNRPLQAISELDRADAIALTGEAVVFSYCLRGSVCGPGKLSGLDVVAPCCDGS